MKKLISVLCFVPLCLCLLCSCGVKEADLSQVLGEINSAYGISGLTQITDKADLQAYYQIEPEDVKQFAAEIDENASDAPLEIVLIEAQSSSAAQNIISKLSNRYNAIYNMYASYGGELLGTVKNCTVTSDGNYVSLIVSTDPGGMLDILYGYIK